MKEMTMSSPQASGASSPRPAGQLQDAVTTFSDAVFEAIQGLLNAQQQLTRTLLSGEGAHSEADVDKERSNGSDEQEPTDPAIADEGDDETDELDAADETDDETDQLDAADETDDETDQLDAADETDELDETDVEPAAGQTGGDTGAAAPAAKAGGRPRRARRPRTAAGTMTSGVN